MKKPRCSKQFLEEIRKTPIVSVVCVKLGISRQTAYRWINGDPDYRKEFEEALRHGTLHINDLAESKLIADVERGDPPAYKYWLNNKHRDYLRPRPSIIVDSILGLRKQKDNNEEQKRVKIYTVTTREEVEFLKWKDEQDKKEEGDEDSMVY